MSAQYTSKHGIVSRPQCELFMAFVDMRRFVNMLPEDKRQSIKADYDSISASVQGFFIGVRVREREPYRRIVLGDDGAPFSFTLTFNFVDGPSDGKTDFSIELEADLNGMMKMMIGRKIQEALDKIVDGLVDASEGRMPEGFDPSSFNM